MQIFSINILAGLRSPDDPRTLMHHPQRCHTVMQRPTATKNANEYFDRNTFINRMTVLHLYPLDLPASHGSNILNTMVAADPFLAHHLQ